MKKALFYFLAFMAVQLIVGGIASVVLNKWFPTVSSTDSTALLITVGVSNVILIALFLLLRWYTVSRTYIRSRPWVTLTWTALLALGSVIPSTWLEEQLPKSWQLNILGEEMANMLRSTEGYFVICMLAPLAEEIIFRGAIISALMKWFAGRSGNEATWGSLTKGEWIAVGCSTVLFAVGHVNPAQIPHALIFGILLGWLFVKTGSIVPGLLVHWINNTVAYVMVNVFPTLPIDAPLKDYVGGSDAAVARAVICSLMIFLPALYQLIRIPREKA